MHRSKNNHLRLADRPADYDRLGISPVDVAQLEDGQRIGTERGRYEWWYFDAHLDDGATVVVVFFTKPNVSPNSPLAPRVSRDARRHSDGAWALQAASQIVGFGLESSKMHYLSEGVD